MLYQVLLRLLSLFSPQGDNIFINYDILYPVLLIKIIYIKFVQDNLMADNDEKAQKRRQKILSRVSKEQEQQMRKQSQNNISNVYDRYKIIKLRQQTQKQLILMSRMSGIIMVPLAYLFAPWLIFTVVVTLLIAAGILLFNGEEDNQKDLPIMKFLPFLSKLKYLKLITFVLKIIVNSIFSFILVSVLVNASLVQISHHESVQNHIKKPLHQQPSTSIEVQQLEIPSIQISTPQIKPINQAQIEQQQIRQL